MVSHSVVFVDVSAKGVQCISCEVDRMMASQPSHPFPCLLRQLRAPALRGDTRLGPALEGLLNAYTGTNNKEELEVDLGIIKKWI